MDWKRESAWEWMRIRVGEGEGEGEGLEGVYLVGGYAWGLERTSF